MSDWYDNYRERIRKEAENVKPVDEVSQQVLQLKAIGSEAFENDDNHYTFSSGDKFGFSEQFVNQLMQFAFDQGRKDVDEKSFNAGHNQCWQEVMNNLGVVESEEN